MVRAVSLEIVGAWGGAGPWGDRGGRPGLLGSTGAFPSGSTEPEHVLVERRDATYNTRALVTGLHLIYLFCSYLHRSYLISKDWNWNLLVNECYLPKWGSQSLEPDPLRGGDVQKWWRSLWRRLGTRGCPACWRWRQNLRRTAVWTCRICVSPSLSPAETTK